MKSCTFYIFDGDKANNFDRAFSIFETFGAPVSDVIDVGMRKAKCDDVFCSITLDESKVTSMEIATKNLNVSRDLLNELDTTVDLKKWKQFT